MKYQVKQTTELIEHEIEHILQLWDITVWNTINSDYFRKLFKDSEFHLLLDESDCILAVIRINFDFALEISGEKISLAEAVGLVSTHRKKGYGAKLVQYFKDNVIQRNMETIGFCHEDLRPFYKKCHIEILFDKAKAIKENISSEWVSSEDDDILIFNISHERKQKLSQLSSQNSAYLITKE